MNGGSKMWRAIAAIIGIAAIDIALISQGVNGTIAIVSVAAIAGLGGYPISQWLTQAVQNYRK